jgi:hypothetical protein
LPLQICKKLEILCSAKLLFGFLGPSKGGGATIIIFLITYKDAPKIA